MSGTAIRRLLLIEDNSGDARLIREMLAEQPDVDIEMTHVQCMRDAEAHLTHNAADIVLLDLGLSDAQGLEAVQRVRTAAPHVPLVMLTALDDESLAARALQEGAQDYLIKGEISPRGLVRALRYAMGRTAAETALQGSELRFRQLAESISEVFFIFDLASGEPVYVSPAYEQVWGRTCESLYLEPGSWAHCVHSDDRERALAHLTGQSAGRFDHEYRILRPDGALRWVRVRGFPILDPDGNQYRRAAVASDITHEKQLDYLSFYDPLTGLANRTLFLDRVGQTLIAASAQSLKFAVLALDIERFKTVNEGLGRKAGDDLLRQVAERLLQAGRPQSFFARVAGDRFATLQDGSRLARVAADHFTIVSTRAQSEEQLARFTQHTLEQCFTTPFRIGEAEVRISATIGIAVFPGDGADAETLLNNATSAVRKARAGGERYAFFTQEMNERSSATLTLENKLRRAVENEEFVLHYQPKVDLLTRRITAVEALIRWQSPGRGLVSPGEFIPLMEERGMIVEVGAWALSKATEDHARWVEMGLAAPRIAVNVSPVQLRKSDFLAMLKAIIRHGAKPPGIDLEITESMIMEDVEGNIRKLREIEELGVSIAIDDFGTGYSSLAYLAKLPLRTLKIDRSFVVAMLGEPDTMTLVQMIISLAHSLRLKVVAEGVELEEQARTLRLLNCDEMQGYLYSRPVPFDALAALLQAQAEIEPTGPGDSHFGLRPAALTRYS